MGIVIGIIIVLLLIKFPPGTNLVWSMGGHRVVWPVGWCLAVTLILSVLLSLFRKP